MIRLGWQRFLVMSAIALGTGALAGETGLGIAFMVVGFAAIAALVQAPRHHRAPHPEVWYLLAASLGLFLLGGIADAITVPADGSTATYPGWREPFDFLAYCTSGAALLTMARARHVHRDRTNMLDALIGVFGIGSVVWSTIMVEFLSTPALSASGRATGVAFSLITLVLGYGTIRVAIGPGSRPGAYYFLATAAGGGFVAEVLLELELIGRTPFGGTEILSTAASAISFVMLAAAALHPSMAELTVPPVEATPHVTGRRLVAMTGAVLAPPALLIVDQARDGRLEASIIVALWASISILVMVRVHSLSQVRERIARLDRVLAEADAGFVTAAGESDMHTSALVAAARVAGTGSAVDLHVWEDASWCRTSRRGLILGGPLSAAPMPAGSVERRAEDDRVRTEVHLSYSAGRSAILGVESGRQLDELEVSRLATLAMDLGKAIESASLREQVTRDRYERRFRALVERSVDIIMVLDDDFDVQFVSPAGPRLLGYTERDFLGRRLSDFVLDADEAVVTRLLSLTDNALDEVRLRCVGGSYRWFEMRVGDLRDEPEVAGLVVTASEITAQKQAELDLRRSEARFRSLVQHSSDLVSVLDGEGVISWVSPSVVKILGVESTAAVDREFVAFVHPEDRQSLRRGVEKACETADSATFELRVRHHDLAWRTLEVTITDLRSDPSVEGMVLNAYDVTERKRLEHSLRHQVLHDDLTGIPNRVLFRDRIEQALSRRDAEVAVLVIDLDDFKTVNDGLGHSAGDEVLKVVSFRLSQFLRSGDTAARLGGDEFAIMLVDIASRGDALAVCQRLLRVIEEPIDVEGREIRLHASAGLVFSSDLDDPQQETILRSADLAMYGAKSRGKGRVAIFDESMHEGVFERLELKADLAHALERDELRLHYQAVIDLATGAIAGFEALMRWHHPVRGTVSPATFIPLAEETGLIVPIGRWLAAEALSQLREWQEAHPNLHLTMSINVSGRQLEDEGIVGDISETLRTVGIDPSCVVIELTESIVVEDSPLLVQRLQEIRALGVGLYADDFGSGFASYSALQSLPFTGVKIDRSLVSGLDGDAADRASAQIRSIIEMAAETGLRVVAEGIESGAQAQALQRLRCGFAQGFYFARPSERSAVAFELGEHLATVAHEPLLGL